MPISVPGPHDGIDGLNQLDKVINITQEPIGRNPRPTRTYVGLLGDIRKVLPACRGPGPGLYPGPLQLQRQGRALRSLRRLRLQKIEMHFLADVWVRCKSARQALQPPDPGHTYKGKNIAEVWTWMCRGYGLLRGPSRHPPPAARPCTTWA